MIASFAEVPGREYHKAAEATEKTEDGGEMSQK